MTERTRTAAPQRILGLLDWLCDDSLESPLSHVDSLTESELEERGVSAKFKELRDEFLALLAERDAAVAALREAKAELTNETVSYQDGKPLPLDPLTDIDNAIAVIDVALAAVGEAEEPQ